MLWTYKLPFYFHATSNFGCQKHLTLLSWWIFSFSPELLSRHARLSAICCGVSKAISQVEFVNQVLNELQKVSLEQLYNWNLHFFKCNKPQNTNKPIHFLHSVLNAWYSSCNMFTYKCVQLSINTTRHMQHLKHT